MSRKLARRLAAGDGPGMRAAHHNAFEHGIAATTKKLEKTQLLSEYLKSVPVEEAAIAAVFFSGRPFPTWEETTLQVGGTMLWRILSEQSGRSDTDLTKAYREHGDLGAVA